MLQRMAAFGLMVLGLMVCLQLLFGAVSVVASMFRTDKA